MVTPPGDNDLSESQNALFSPTRHFPLISDQSLTLSLTFTLTNPFQCNLSLSKWWCVFCLFTQYLSVFLFHRKNLFLLNLINRYIKSVTFEKQRHYGTLQSKFLISANYLLNVIQRKLFIKCNTESCCEHITDSIDIYLCACASQLAPVYAMYLCLSMCDIKSEYQQKAKSCVRPQQTDALLHKTHRKVLAVLRYQGLTCVDPQCH